MALAPLERLLSAASRFRRTALHLLMGRRFMHTLERNREAADRLDRALKEVLASCEISPEP
ncbi:hypothetical protein [Tropicimonas marinistellae]|uniref:hypothetical protein n=1 Tax=Tropicimonas marinistellae TaxID=1739787 RepID=UPI000831C26E|nr:hypothetical protein [Tropicimonas marinistellae]